MSLTSSFLTVDNGLLTTVYRYSNLKVAPPCQMKKIGPISDPMFTTKVMHQSIVTTASNHPGRAGDSGENVPVFTFASSTQFRASAVYLFILFYFFFNAKIARIVAAHGKTQ